MTTVTKVQYANGLIAGTGGAYLSTTAGSLKIVNTGTTTPQTLYSSAAGAGANAAGTTQTDAKGNVSFYRDKDAGPFDIIVTATSAVLYAGLDPDPDVDSLTQIGLKAPVLVPTALKTAAYTAAVNDLVLTNTTGGTFAVTLPSAPADKAQVGVQLLQSAGAPVAVTYAAGAGDSLGPTLSGSIPLVGELLVLQYQASTTTWRPVGARLPLAGLDGRYDAAGLAATKVASVTATDATIVVGGTATAPTVGVGVIPESKVTNLVTDLAAKVASVTAADATVVVGGTAAAPTVGVGTIPESKVTNLVTDLAAKAPQASPTFTGITTAPEFSASGLTGATAASRYVGATASGAPASGTFAIGDFVIDQTAKVWVCTVAGTPGTFTQVGSGGGGNSAYPPVLSGSWYGQGVSYSDGGSYTVGMMVATPLDTVGFSINGLSVQVVAAAAGATFHLGIYAGTTVPGALILDAGTIDASTTGIKTLTISSTALPPRCFAVAVLQGASGAILRTPLASPTGWGAADQPLSASGSAPFGCQASATTTTGSLPASFGTLGGNAPSSVYSARFGLKAA